MNLEELYLAHALFKTASALVAGYAIARAVKHQEMWDITAAGALTLLFMDIAVG